MVLEVDDDAVGAGLGDDAVERHHHDAGIAGLLDGAVERVGRGGVDDDGVVALQDQVLDLRRLGRHFLVGGGEDVGGGDDLVGHRLLGHDVIALEHRLTPGIAGVVVGKGNAHAGRVRIGRGRSKQQRCPHDSAKRERFCHLELLSNTSRLLASPRLRGHACTNMLVSERPTKGGGFTFMRRGSRPTVAHPAASGRSACRRRVR